MKPHHDGSVLYAPQQQLQLGQSVQLRMRIPRSMERIASVHLRSVRDAEPHYDQATLIEQDDAWSWYVAELTVINPKTRYRWLIQQNTTAQSDGEHSSMWLNATGIHLQDVPDNQDFVITSFPWAPEWVKSQVMYQIFPDRFARSAQADQHEAPGWAIPCSWDNTPVIGKGPETPYQFYGGDLPGIEEKLDHLAGLGVSLIYLTPLFPARSNHRYDASTFTEVDELLGGDAALVSLVQAAHQRGIKVIGDLTTNHSGDQHEWFVDSHRNPDSAYSDFYYYQDDKNEDYVSWLGVSTLPKFNWHSGELRSKFFLDDDSVLKRWLAAPYHLDGWRIDVGNMTGRQGADDLNHEIASLVREQVQQVNPGAMVVAESTSDAAADFAGDTWHGAMTYTNFTRPLWQWLASGTGELSYFGLPQVRPDKITAQQFVHTQATFLAGFPWNVRQNNMLALDTHDIPRISNAITPGTLPVAIGLQFTLPGIPVLFQGDEFGLEGFNGEDSRTPMPWADPSRVIEDLREFYAQMAHTRRENIALIDGAVRWIPAGDDALVLAREHPEQTLFVLATRTGAEVNIAAEEFNLAASEYPQGVTLETTGPTFFVGSWDELVQQYASPEH